MSYNLKKNLDQVKFCFKYLIKIKVNKMESFHK